MILYKNLFSNHMSVTFVQHLHHHGRGGAVRPVRGLQHPHAPRPPLRHRPHQPPQAQDQGRQTILHPLPRRRYHANCLIYRFHDFFSSSFSFFSNRFHDQGP